MSHFAFVVLHYLHETDTIECVSSLMRLQAHTDMHVVIVDNASPDGSGQCLQKKYQDNSAVTVLLNEKNLGFARGNNVGFRYAKQVLDPEYIALINNDTKIEQTDFCERVEGIYKSTPFAVLGPKIVSLVDGINQNPVPYALFSTWRVLRRMIMTLVLYFSSFIGVDQVLSREKRFEENRTTLAEYQLHGCCWIFSKQFIQRYDGLYPRTFMYGEEDILKYICESNHLVMLYSDKVEIYHKEGSSTSAAWGKGGKKRRFYYKQTIRSLSMLLFLRLKKTTV